MSDLLANEHEILQSAAKILKYLPLFFDDEVSVALTNREIFLVNIPPPSLPIQGGYGDKIPPGGISEAIRTGEVTVREIPESVYGVPFRSYPVPLKDENGEVVCVLALGRSLERGEQMRKMSRTLSDFLSKSVDTVSKLSDDVQQLAITNQDLAEKSRKAMVGTRGTAEIVKVIQNISLQTNLLGINAAIEAANSGEAGIGFRVVAEEIQNLSKSATASAKSVEAMLDEMTNLVEYISTKIQSSNEIFQSQASVLRGILVSLNDLNEVANQVRALADQF